MTSVVVQAAHDTSVFPFHFLYSQIQGDTSEIQEERERVEERKEMEEETFIY